MPAHFFWYSAGLYAHLRAYGKTLMTALSEGLWSMKTPRGLINGAVVFLAVIVEVI